MLSRIYSYKTYTQLGFNQYCKSDKISFIIYEDLGSLIVKIDGCKNKMEKLSMTKVSDHIPSGFSISTISSFNDIENKHDAYRGKSCIKKMCKSLREHAMKIIIFKKKKL